MRLSASDLKDLQILKHYRIIRKWACKNNGLTDADLEVLIKKAAYEYAGEVRNREFPGKEHTYAMNPQIVRNSEED